VESASTELQKLGPSEQSEALRRAGVEIPGPGSVPDTAWQKMSGAQVFWLLVIMFVVLVALFVLLLWFGVSLVRDTDSSETAKTVGTTIVGAALGMIGASAAGAGAATASARKG
jgi:RNA polymerase subunit RPABC4/transcription elongation factor Spt4